MKDKKIILESSEKKETSTRRIKYNQSKNFFSARCDIPFLFFANAELWPCGFPGLGKCGSAHNVTIPRFTNDKASAS